MNDVTELSLDPATFLFCMSLFAFMMSAISYSTESTLGKNIAGLSDWWKAMFITGMAFLLFYLRGRIPNFWSLYVANTMVIAVGVYVILAHARFFNSTAPRKTLAVLAVAGIGGTSYSYYFMENSSGFVLAVSLPMALMLVLLIHSIVTNTKWRVQRSTWISIVSMGLTAFALLARSWKVLFSDSQSAELYARSATQIGFLIAGALCIMGTSMGFILMVHEKHRNDILESSKRDGLTGLYHRAAFLDFASKIQNSYNEPFSLLMVDIDHFKSVNDSFGHAAGDTAIMHVARLISSSIRNTDLAGRYGGEEFCILLRNCGKAEVERFAERLVSDASKQRIRMPEGKEVSVTISVGYSTRLETRRKDDAEVSPQTLLDIADQALLVAKRTGRNRAVAA